MKLLFITQKLHGQDAFTALWVEAFMRRGFDVSVLCLEKNIDDMNRVLGRAGHPSFETVSMEKEKGAGKAMQIMNFMKEISSRKYDRVFIHMTPVWGMVGAPVWLARRTPVYLWYTHYKMQAGLRILGFYAKRMFCATPQSLPQYEGSSKKVVVGHGIDMSFWPERNNITVDPKRLLVVHRLSRSKRLEIVLRALVNLPEYSLDIYGMDAERKYAREMRSLTDELKLNARVTFKGSAPMKDLPDIYAKHRLILNMASETIDKTMLEAMTCGCYPVTTKGNADAIGIPEAPAEDTPEALAAFINKYAEKPPMSGGEMYDIVQKRHSLDALIGKMDTYIRSGT